MAEIHFSRGKAYQLAPNCDEHPTEYVESEGERLIKQMVQKQMNTSVTLEQQLNKSKEFETCTEFVPITKYASGQIALAEFKEFAQKIDHLQDLKSSGLTEMEINLLSDYEKGEKFFEEKYKKVENSALQSSIQEIKKKLQQRSEDFERIKSDKEKGISRHELELSLSVKPESDHTKLLQFALSCQSNKEIDSRPLDHPINKLKEIEHELFSHLRPVSPKRKKKRYSVKERKHTIEIQPQPSCSLVQPISLGNPVTLWDSHDAPNPAKRKTVNKKTSEVHQYTCSSKPLYTIQEGKIVSLNKSIRPVECEERKLVNKGDKFIVTDIGGKFSGNLIPIQSIQENRITIEEILKSPHFKNYCKGEPSEVLYVKNLSKSVEEIDLVNYFGHFETPGRNKIAYRLMSGRMRGQAFITFPDAEKAAIALEALNGCYCKGKPLIIQFGKPKS